MVCRKEICVHVETALLNTDSPQILPVIYRVLVMVVWNVEAISLTLSTLRCVGSLLYKILANLSFVNVT